MAERTFYVIANITFMGVFDAFYTEDPRQTNMTKDLALAKGFKTLGDAIKWRKEKIVNIDATILRITIIAED